MKKRIIANAVATGNTFMFNDLFARLAEFSTSDGGSAAETRLHDHLSRLLTAEDDAGSADFQAACKLVEKHTLEDDTVPAGLLEATAKRAMTLGKFAYAEDAYRLLGIKKEIVALCAQTGEQFLRENRPRHAAMSFFAAASIDQSIGPHYQYLGPQLHVRCPAEPGKCATTLSGETLLDACIHFLLPIEPLAERLITNARPEHKGEVVATLAVCRDLDFSALVNNLRKAVAELSKLDDGEAGDYSSIGPALLGRETASGEAWQELCEFCFEHPLGALCVCLKIVKRAPVIVPVVRDGKSLIEHILPAEFLQT